MNPQRLSFLGNSSSKYLRAGLFPSRALKMVWRQTGVYLDGDRESGDLSASAQSNPIASSSI
jgi:hypothetical protein